MAGIVANNVRKTRPRVKEVKEGNYEEEKRNKHLKVVLLKVAQRKNRSNV